MRRSRVGSPIHAITQVTVAPARWHPGAPSDTVELGMPTELDEPDAVDGHAYRTLRHRAEAAEAELQHRVALDRKLFDDAPAARFRTHLDGRGLFEVNRKFCELFGATRDDLIGGPGPLAFANPADRAEVFHRIERDGGFDDLELTFDSPGGPKTVIASATLVHGYLEGMAIDITARKQVEAAHREATARLQLVFETTSDLLVLLRTAAIIRVASTRRDGAPTL